MLPKCRCQDRRCKYYKGIRPDNPECYYCVAFHEGIPDEIAYGNDDHMEIKEGQSKPVYFSLPDKNIVKPHPIHRMESYRNWGRDNLCGTLHNIYLMSDDEEIKYWCRIAVTMAKNMAFALMDYRQMLVENQIGTQRRTHGVHHDSMSEWQIRKKSLYRGENKPSWSKP